MSHARACAIGLSVLLALLACRKDTPVSPTDPAQDRWAAIRAGDVARVSAEWATPIRLPVSDGNWEDSAFVTADGGTVLFTYYPAEDLLSAVLRGGPFVDDLDIYRSDTPFVAKIRDTRYFFSEDVFSAAGQMIADNGDAFYHSNRQGGTDQTDIYRNSERLAFNSSGKSEGNPHYCVAMDELWFDENDQNIYVLKTAAANNFTGQPVLAPAPINAGGQDLQPWLSADCRTMYFATNRGCSATGPCIYMTRRLAADAWSEPTLVIQSRTGVGEPSLTADGRRLFFIQLFQDDQGRFTSDIFYTQRR